MSDDVQKPQWFTIKQAAEYLEVGEPTLYRWMRDNRITFRKVGDSTRFLQQDLDAMVQVHPSAKEVETVTEICPVCHHTDLAPGRMQSTGLVYFRPQKTKFWTILSGDVTTQAKMCARCGYISWFGDVGKLDGLREATEKAEKGEKSEKKSDAKGKSKGD